MSPRIPSCAFSQAMPVVLSSPLEKACSMDAVGPGTEGRNVSLSLPNFSDHPLNAFYFFLSGWSSCVIKFSSTGLVSWVGLVGR